MTLKQEIGMLNFDWRQLITMVNESDTWYEDLFIKNILKSADAIRPYLTEEDEINVPQIIIALCTMLVEYAKGTHVLPGVKHHAASLYLAEEIATWLHKPESFIDVKIKGLSEGTVGAILDKYEKHIDSNGTLDYLSWFADKD